MKDEFLRHLAEKRAVFECDVEGTWFPVPGVDPRGKIPEKIHF